MFFQPWPPHILIDSGPGRPPHIFFSCSVIKNPSHLSAWGGWEVVFRGGSHRFRDLVPWWFLHRSRSHRKPRHRRRSDPVLVQSSAQKESLLRWLLI